MKKHLLAAAVLAALGTGSANALVISGGSFSNALETTEISQSGNLSLFDSTLGTLIGATLTLTGQDVMTITLTNNAAQAQLTSATGVVDLFFSSSLAALDLLLSAGNPIVSLTNPTGANNIPAGGSLVFGPLADSDSAVLNPAPAMFAQAGGGSFSISCQSLSGITIVGGGGNIASEQVTDAACGAGIEYEYEVNQTPEPASMALVGLGLLGLGVARRRKAA